MKEQISRLLDDLPVKYRSVKHKAVFTVADLAELNDGTKPIKNLLIQEDSGIRKFLVVMVGDQRLDLKDLRIKLNSKRLRFASDNTLLQTFGVTPGAVSIFGMLNKGADNVEVIIDGEILNEDQELGFHPNDNTATIFFNAKDLESILKKIGCNYKIMKLY
jgi:Ala-tRNA(Pro) deacylase